MAKPKPDRWSAPDWMTPDAKRWHRATIDQLRSLNQLDTAQPIHALLLAQALGQYERCTIAINERGQVLTIRNDKGEVKSEEIAPEAQLQLRLLDKIRALLKDLNLNGTKGDEDRPEDPIQALRERMAGFAGGGHADRN